MHTPPSASAPPSSRRRAAAVSSVGVIASTEEMEMLKDMKCVGYALLGMCLVLRGCAWVDEPHPVAAKQQKIVSVLDFGAVGNGGRDDAPAIQAALDSGAKTVTIPAGLYRINSTLLVGSGTTVLADSRAVVRLADGVGTNVSVFVISNKGGDRNITVDGGVWDGNNQHNIRPKDGTDPTVYTGVAVSFIGVTNLTLRNMTIRNPDSFSIRLGEVRDFRVENITLDHTILRPNQDGIHVGGFSENGVIRKISAIHPNAPNDDMVALNADDDVTRAPNLGLKCGPIRNILVEDLQAESAWNFLRIFSCGSRAENITVRNVKGGCRVHAVNLDCWRFPRGSGDVRNVRLENFSVAKVHPGGVMIPINLNIRGLHISDFERIPHPRGEEVPTLVLHNDCDNRIRLNGEPLQTLRTLSIPQGGIKELRMNCD